MELLKLGYLAAAILFVFALKGMSHPRTAVRGNLIGAFGMALAVGIALIGADDADATRLGLPNYWYVAVGIAVGAAIGLWLAWTVKMTGMPQMVALLNGFGGAASVFVAGGELIHRSFHPETASPTDAMAAIGLSGIIGAVTFFGSCVAYAKLEEIPAFKRPFVVPSANLVNAALFGLSVLLTVLLAWIGPGGGAIALYVVIVLLTSALGVLLVNPIGGADMPVVISLLNSYSGLAAAATGFVIDNNGLIISGSLVGASGIILSQLMCQAMNRSLTNVLFGVMEAGSLGGKADEMYANVRSTTPDDVAILLDTASRVVFVPGYGMAVSQAQHAVRDLAKLLEAKGIEVEYAIHPVAGRMPGHMNVLLAEADVDYEKLKEMDQINSTFETVDVAIVIGANDTVNPLARTDPKSPIAGMPILNVDAARAVVVVKRSLSPGFAGIPNPLFAAPNTQMLFADGQQAVLDVAAAIKALDR